MTQARFFPGNRRKRRMVARVLGYEGPPVVRGVNVKLIHDHILGLEDVSVGQRQALLAGLQWALDGREEAAGGLMDFLGADRAVDLIVVLVEANAPPLLLQEAIRSVVLFSHKDLPGVVARAGGRQAFATWCRKAQFEMPVGLPDTVTIARGTHSVIPDVNVAGMHWSLGNAETDAFDGAAFFACGAPSPVVAITRVPREALIYFVPGTLPVEVLIADVPAEYEIVTDPVVIAEGAVRFSRYRRDLVCGRPYDPSLYPNDHRMACLLAWDEARQRDKGAGQHLGLFRMS